MVRCFIVAALMLAALPALSVAARPSAATSASLGRPSAKTLEQPDVPTPRETTLYVFKGDPDGGHPDSQVTFTGGAFFGVTTVGGVDNLGAVYKLAPPQAKGGSYVETVLHSFTGGHDGEYPYYGLTTNKNGDLYGATMGGGDNACGGGCGVAFEMERRVTRPYVERVIYHFRGGSDGRTPSAPPIFTAGGILYGTTQAGGGTGCGGSGCGTVYALAPNHRAHNETVLYRFQGGSDGSAPVAGLITDSTGALYGTTLTGGGSSLCPSGCGTVFKLTPAGSGFSESTIYQFKGGSDGAAPFAGVIEDATGTLFGTTALGGGNYPNGCQYNGESTGCGSVFKLTPSTSGYTKTIIYAFTDGSDNGAGPWGGVIFGNNGTLYGTTVFGGNANCDFGYQCGTIYELQPSGSDYAYTRLFSFPGFPQTFPYAGLLLQNGVLFGTTAQGGVGSCGNSSYACGTVFKITP
jgi:uncharacterized repeat protein (TIGR03803 family)